MRMIISFLFSKSFCFISRFTHQFVNDLIYFVHDLSQTWRLAKAIIIQKIRKAHMQERKKINKRLSAEHIFVLDELLENDIW